MDFLTVAGALMIFISAIGLYAVSAFLLTKQQKEFAIRKIFGASFGALSRLALWRAVKPVLVAIVFACPVAYLYLSDWLEGFAYRIDMPYEIYGFASFGVLLVAIFSVYAIAYRLANGAMVSLLRED